MSDSNSNLNNLKVTSIVDTNGIAGSTNYAQWDKVAKNLVDEHDAIENAETVAAKNALGHGKYPRSQAEAEEMEKSKQVERTKKALQKYQKRESQLMATFPGLLGCPLEPMNDKSSQSSETTTVRLTRKQLEAGERVVTLCDTSGRSKHDTIVLTSDLSLLESQMTVQNSAKTFTDDAENAVQPNLSQSRSIYGLIKIFLSNVHNCTVRINCKVISGTLEVHKCNHLRVVMDQDATVATIQVDMSQDMTIEFHDASSGKNHSLGPKHKAYWGEDKDDRIFHAGVSNLQVKIFRDDLCETAIACDYLRDGAVSIGNATPEEFQFVTSCVNGKLVCEKVVRTGHSIGKNVRAMTSREVEEEQAKRERAAQLATSMAEDLIQIRDKEGNVLVKRTQPIVSLVTPVKDGVDEARRNGTTQAETEDIVKECEENRKRGNAAFGVGEYGQAILLYSLSLDKADELPDAMQSLFSRDVLFSNRSACFLKLGQHEKALEDAERAILFNSRNVKATFRKGLALHAMGRHREAMPVLAEAYKIEPNNKQVQQALRFCEARLKEELRKMS